MSTSKPAHRAAAHSPRRLSRTLAVGIATGLLTVSGLFTGLLTPAYSAGPSVSPVHADSLPTVPAQKASSTVPGMPSTAPSTTQFGVYTGPGRKGVDGANAFSTWSGHKVERVLDFLPYDSWSSLANNSWLIDAYAGTGYHLDLSVPMLTSSGGGSLAQCADGTYDAYWTGLGSKLVAAGLPDTTLRLGWEMNGNWYPWAAAGRTNDYIGCYRHIVEVTRTVPGAHFSYAWSPNLGAGSFPAEQAYPGDAYVDDIAVDAYDTSWTWNPTPVGVSTTQARANSWAWIQRGDHGLDFWSAFARSHNKPLALGEWGATWRSDGHGGGDNTGYVNSMFDFIDDPANKVAYATYFNSADSASPRHDLMRPDTVFPTAAAAFRQRLQAVGGQRAAIQPWKQFILRVSGRA